ncbi:MAG: thioredoxin family protein [Pirellulales bacterium]|nr:thioredoxin family protein [Pirellulales bacterium]
MISPRRCIVLAWLFVALLGAIGLGAAMAHAQPAGAGLLDDGPLAGSAAQPEAQIAVAAEFTAPSADAPAQLQIRCTIQPGWHIYSLTQPPGGPLKSKIKLAVSPQYKLAGEFVAVPPPHIGAEPIAFPGISIESHEGDVLWYVPLEFTEGVDPTAVEIKGIVNVQACDANGCMPPTDYPFVARLGKAAAIAAAAPAAQPGAAPAPAEPSAAGSAGFRESGSATALEGYVERAESGGGLRLVITAMPDPGYHIYAWADRDPEQISKPTLIVTEQPADWTVSQPLADREPITHPLDGVPGATESYYDRPVTWTIELRPTDEPKGPVNISGLIGYQSCTESGCDKPRGATFQAMLDLGGSMARVPLVFAPGKYKEAAEAAVSGPGSSLNLEHLQVQTSAASDASLGVRLVGGFLGGLLLNFMPCVLPVIGLKILSFVQQSGESRLRVFSLNLWYSAGLIAVFLVLAWLAVSLKYGWGQLFTKPEFNIALAAVVFTMGLSFLGIWEVPIPGFATGGSAQKLANKEGPAGAFAKGVVTTLLATPCTGPFMGTAVAWAVKQPAPSTFAVFTAVGLGMASPYLMIGAFPRLIRWLPKPGAWMDLFKQFMGFLLLGTVVWLLMSVPGHLVIPSVAFLFGLWMACWWYGRVPLHAEFGERVIAWAGAIALSVIFYAVSFSWLDDVMESRFNLLVARAVDQARMNDANPQFATAPEAPAAHQGEELPWQPFSMKRLEALTAANQTVMVDFTADWCTTCKFLEKTVLNQRETKDLVLANEVVTLVADMTHDAPEETKLLEAVAGTRQVPVLAIFPAGRPNEPIVFAEPYSKSTLLDALRKAGPSRVTDEVRQARAQ